MKTFGISSFRSITGGVYGYTDNLTWQDLIQHFDQHVEYAEKRDAWLFSGTRFEDVNYLLQHDFEGCSTDWATDNFTVRRKQKYAKDVQLLILDYDGTLTIAEAKMRFQGYTYFGYTSYGHQKKSGVDKFRLVFPLTEPIPAYKKFAEDGRVIEQGAYYDLSEAIMAFAPGTDPAILNPIQPYFIPSAPPERMHLAQRWCNDGEILDWTSWDRNQAYATKEYPSTLPRKVNGMPNRKLDRDQTFVVKGKVINARDVKGRVQRVTCPFHGDTRGSEFLMKYENSGVICFTCKKCGTFTLAPEENVPIAASGPVAPTKAFDPEDLLEFDDFYWDHRDRDQVKASLEKIKTEILADTGRSQMGKIRGGPTCQFASHILYLPEGAGKSHLALSFLNDPAHRYFYDRSDRYLNQIIFACKSWKQAQEQFEKFDKALKLIGRKCRMAWSFDGLIYHRFKVKIKRTATRGYDMGDILEEESIAEIIKKHPKLSTEFIRVTWNTLRGEADRFHKIANPHIVSTYGEFNTNDEDRDDEDGATPPAMIVTTIAQLRLLNLKHDRIPLNWIVWIDDPDLDDCLDIQPSANGQSSQNGKSEIINGTTYYKRDEDKSLGRTFPAHRSIYTTTEELTVRALKYRFEQKHERYVVHGGRDLVTGGKITILGTKYVQQDFDAIVSLIARRLNITLIADGIPADFNHSTNKGRNDLDKRDLLVEISQPHPGQIKTVCDALNLDHKSNHFEIANQLMVDKLHQAVGRNAGFRTQGFECVVLVDKNKHRALTTQCGYQIDQANSVLIDRTQQMARTTRRITDSASVVTQNVESFLNQFHTYASDQRKIRADIKFVIENQPEEKQALYIRRLLVALTSISSVRFDVSLDQVMKNPLSQTYWHLGRWISDQFIGPDKKDMVMNYYKERIGPTVL